MAVGNWAEVDYYAVLGVQPTATDEEIARAFRVRAKQLHPDAGVTINEHDQFTLVVAAYDVLSDPKQRYDYDDVRAGVLDTQAARPVVVAAQPPAPPARPPMVNWTPRKATATVAAGIVCALLGIAFTAFILGLQAHERADRAGRVRVQATASIDADANTHLTFRTTNGKDVTIPDPPRLNPGVLHDGDRLTLLYLPKRPTDVIVDETHFGRDFTYWFIAVKLIVCGPVIAALGVRKRRSLRRKAGAARAAQLVPVAVPA